MPSMVGSGAGVGVGAGVGFGVGAGVGVVAGLDVLFGCEQLVIINTVVISMNNIPINETLFFVIL